MYDTIRDSSAGQSLRFISGNRLLAYPEERRGFQLPQSYAPGTAFRTSEVSLRLSVDSDDDEKRKSEVPSEGLGEGHWDGDQMIPTQRSMDLEKKPTLEPEPSEPGVTLVTWYSDTDGDNPHNWSKGKKLWVGFLILIYSLAVYIGASLYTAAIPTMKQMWGLGSVAASVGLSMYVVGYGLGPLILSPLSELPQIGRNPPYIIGFAIFVVLCVPTALVDNYAGMLVLRFLTGFFGSPALASGGASYGDIYDPLHLPYAIALWVGGATTGPALGPLVSNFAVVAENWRWAFWELLWLSGPVFLAMFFFLPETSADCILLQRAKRLRKLTGRTDLKAQCEVRQQKDGRKTILYQALIKPWEINAKDPAVLFTTIYTGLIYGIYYSFFESFPLVFLGVYNWSFQSMGLAYLSIAVGCLLAVLFWVGFFYFYANKRIAAMMATGITAPPEARLVPGLLFTFFIPAGLFIFAWTSRESVHWVVPLIGVSMSMIGNFVISQCMLIYLPFTYPRYASSLFAANGLSRASLAAAAILFSIPMFDNLGVDKGVTLLGGLCCGCCVGIYILFFFGARLRKRSKFAEG